MDGLPVFTRSKTARSAQKSVLEFLLFQKLVRGIGSANVDHRVRQRDFSDHDAATGYPTIRMGG